MEILKYLKYSCLIYNIQRRKIPSSHFLQVNMKPARFVQRLYKLCHQAQCPDLEAGGLVASARQSFTTLHIPGLYALNFPPVIILTEFPDNERPQ